MIHIYIRSMSESARDIRRDLKGPAKKILEHICKLALFPGAQECDHWRNEIYSFIHEVSKQDPKNRYPTQKFIVDATWGVCGDMVGAFLYLVEGNYSNYTPDQISVHDTELMAEQYFVWLAKELSIRGVVRRDNVKQKLQGLGL